MRITIRNNNPNHIIASNIYYLQKAWKSAIPVFESFHKEHGSFPLGGIPYEKAKDQIETVISVIKGGSDRIKNIVKELRDFARYEPSNISEMLTEAVVFPLKHPEHILCEKIADDFTDRNFFNNNFVNIILRQLVPAFWKICVQLNLK